MKVFAVAVLILAILALINLNRIKFWMRARRDDPVAYTLHTDAQTLYMAVRRPFWYTPSHGVG